MEESWEHPWKHRHADHDDDDNGDDDWRELNWVQEGDRAVLSKTKSSVVPLPSTTSTTTMIDEDDDDNYYYNYY